MWRNDIDYRHIYMFPMINLASKKLTHWGRVTHICVGNLTIIGSVNGLSPGRRQAIIWSNAGILIIGPIATNFIEILIKIITFSFKKMRSKVSSGKRRPSCRGLNVLIGEIRDMVCSSGLMNPSQSRHMIIMVPQITGTSTVCSTACSDQPNE